MSYRKTPADALMRQLASISEAVEKLQAALDEITGSTNPETAGWDDVARFARIADAAERFLEATD